MANVLRAMNMIIEPLRQHQQQQQHHFIAADKITERLCLEGAPTVH